MSPGVGRDSATPTRRDIRCETHREHVGALRTGHAGVHEYESAAVEISVTLRRRQLLRRVLTADCLQRGQ